MIIGKPLILTPENRAASIAESKTMTRRVCPQPIYFERLPAEASPGEIAILRGELWKCYQYSAKIPDAIKWRKIKPRYKVGEIVYMPEPYVIQQSFANGTIDGLYLDDGRSFRNCLSEKEQQLFFDRKYPYRNTSARFMYKSLARHFFKITGVKAERLQDITHGDMRREGVVGIPCGPGTQDYSYEKPFIDLWNSINEKRGCGWDKNLWVFADTYRKVEI